MNIIVIVGVLIVSGVVGFIFYDMFKGKKNYEKVIISYSEKVGNGIIEHDHQYNGKISLKDDIFKIKELGITMPVPPINTFIPTKKGFKKIYLIKLDAFRFGFRVINMDNSIYVQERDINGNLVKINGKPKLKKYRWQYCDDVVEPDVKHWDENIMETLRQKHKTRGDILSRWVGPIVLGLILVSGIVVIHLTTKYAGEIFDKVQTIAETTAKQVEENAGLIGNLIKKVENSDKT